MAAPRMRAVFGDWELDWPPRDRVHVFRASADAPTFAVLVVFEGLAWSRAELTGLWWLGEPLRVTGRREVLAPCIVLRGTVGTDAIGWRGPAVRLPLGDCTGLDASPAQSYGTHDIGEPWHPGTLDLATGAATLGIDSRCDSASARAALALDAVVFRLHDALRAAAPLLGRAVPFTHHAKEPTPR